MNELKFACPECDGPISADASYMNVEVQCPHCSKDIVMTPLQLTVQTDQLAGGTSNAPQAPPSPHKGYGGWLSFFCALQLFAAPVFLLIGLTFLGSLMLSPSYKPEGLVSILVLCALVETVVVIYGIYAALRLRGLHLDAVPTVKQFLIVALVLSAIELIVAIFADTLIDGVPLWPNWDHPIRERILTPLAVSFGRTVLVVIIWFRYFTISKRVKATYHLESLATQQTRFRRMQLIPLNAFLIFGVILLVSALMFPPLKTVWIDEKTGSEKPFPEPESGFHFWNYRPEPKIFAWSLNAPGGETISSGTETVIGIATIEPGKFAAVVVPLAVLLLILFRSRSLRRKAPLL